MNLDGRKSERLEYAFSIIYKILNNKNNDKIEHDLVLIPNSSISEILEVFWKDKKYNHLFFEKFKSLNIFIEAKECRLLAARKLAETEVFFKIKSLGLDCSIIDSIGSLIPIPPEILTPFMN